MLEAIGLILIAVLAENMVLVRCMGFSFSSGQELTQRTVRRTGLALILVMVTSALLSWLFNTYVLRFFAVEYLRTLVFTLLMLAAAALVRRLLRLFFPALYRYLEGALSQTVYNCAVLGVALVSAQRGYTLGQTLLYAFASGVGVLLVLGIYTGMQEQAEFDSCPETFRRYPILLITAGLMALALMGFYGLNVK